LKLLPFWDQLPADSRFEKIVASPAPKKIGRQQLARGRARRNHLLHHE
jgi:hypothetical protein